MYCGCRQREESLAPAQLNQASWLLSFPCCESPLLKSFAVHPSGSLEAYTGGNRRAGCARGGAFLLASGTVMWFNQPNGYGYIASDEGGRELFVHRGSIVGDWRTTTLPGGNRADF